MELKLSVLINRTDICMWQHLCQEDFKVKYNTEW
jgi:hypothetical protein